MIISYLLGLFGVRLFPNIIWGKARPFYLWKFLCNHCGGSGLQKFIIQFSLEKAFWTMAFSTQRVMCICALVCSEKLSVLAHKQTENVFVLHVILWEKSMANCAKECVGAYARGHEPSERQTDNNRTRSWERVGETGLSLITVCLQAVPKRLHLWEVIPLQTTNLFSWAPPACTEVKNQRKGLQQRKTISVYSTF